MPPRSRRPLRGKYREVEVLKQVGKLSNIEIAEKLGVTEGAIRYRLKREAEGRIDGRKRRGSQLDRYRAIVEEWIEEQKRKRRRKTIKSLYDVLCIHHSYHGSYDALRRYICIFRNQWQVWAGIYRIGTGGLTLPPLS